MVLWAIEKSLGGEILVPRIPSYRITDVAKAIGPDCEHPIVGIRPGEKVHEEMSTSSDSLYHRRSGSLLCDSTHPGRL